MSIVSSEAGFFGWGLYESYTFADLDAYLLMNYNGSSNLYFVRSTLSDPSTLTQEPIFGQVPVTVVFT